LQLGFEYNPSVGEYGFRGTWVAVHETEKTPMIHINTSSDRIGTPAGHQQASITVAKSIPNSLFAPYVSLTYSGFEKKLIFPFGVNCKLHENWNLIAMNDGRKSHLLLTFSQKDFYLQAGWIWFKHPMLTMGWGF
jgi:hypothetical protein